MNEPIRRLLIAALILMGLGTAALAQSPSHRGDGWSMRIPDGWVAVPQDELDTLNSMMSRGSQGVSEMWVAGYARGGSVFAGHSVLIREAGAPLAWSNYRRGLGGMPLEDVGRVMPGEGWTTEELVAQLPLKVLVVDRDRRRVLINQVDEPSGRIAREFMQIEPGDEEGVMLLWQAGFDEADFGPEVYAAVDSFAWSAKTSAKGSFVVYLVVLGFPIAFVLALWIRIRFTIRKHKQRKLKQANR